MEVNCNRNNDVRQIQSLLQGLMGPIRRAHETPLQLEIDSRGIAMAAWQDFLSGSTEVSRNSDEVITALDSVISLSLTGDRGTPGDQLIEGADLVNDLANWLDRLFEDLRIIDSHAIEILGLRVEGLNFIP